jgi:hypothetical protein
MIWGSPDRAPAAPLASALHTGAKIFRYRSRVCEQVSSAEDGAWWEKVTNGFKVHYFDKATASNMWKERRSVGQRELRSSANSFQGQASRTKPLARFPLDITVVLQRYLVAPDALAGAPANRQDRGDISSSKTYQADHTIEDRSRLIGTCKPSLSVSLMRDGPLGGRIAVVEATSPTSESSLQGSLASLSLARSSQSSRISGNRTRDSLPDPGNLVFDLFCQYKGLDQMAVNVLSSSLKMYRLAGLPEGGVPFLMDVSGASSDMIGFLFHVYADGLDE